MNPEFIFTTCQLGAEPALKKELARKHPELSFAYSRPGFVTFKMSTQTSDVGFVLHSVFARAYGFSLGKQKVDNFLESVEEVLKKVQALKATFSQSKLRLHLWERDQHPSGKEPIGFVPNALANKIKTLLSTKVFADVFYEDSKPNPEDMVFDWIIVDEKEWWLGYHKHSALHSPFPGGLFDLTLPQNAPSRAYLKLEEMLKWSGLKLHHDDVAVEIGSAPGGASFALLNRGLKVIGIDPAEMDKKVLKHKAFVHIQKPVSAVLRSDLPESIQWLLLDMNVAPGVSLFAIDRLASRMKDSLLGVLLTVKLNQWKLADEIPHMLAHLKAMGMIKVRAAQLSCHRQEVGIMGLTRMGSRRRLL